MLLAGGTYLQCGCFGSPMQSSTTKKGLARSVDTARRGSVEAPWKRQPPRFRPLRAHTRDQSPVRLQTLACDPHGSLMEASAATIRPSNDGRLRRVWLV
jgi:hypothetical protein